MERHVPYDIAAERATLGALLLERDAILSVEAWLVSNMFYLQKNEWIYQAIVACAQRRTPPDLATIAAELNARNQLEDIGGYTFLGDLIAETPTAVHVEYYARIVEACAIRRALIKAGGDISGLGYATENDLDATLDQAEQTIFTVSQRLSNNTFTSIGSVLSSYFDSLSALQNRERETIGVPTGYGEFDSLTGGLHASDLIIIGARPSMGKTALALSMAYTQAMDGYRVGVISLEMSGEQLGQRLLAMHADLDLQAMRTGRVMDKCNELIDGIAELQSLSLYVDDTPGLSIGQVRAKARRLAATYRLDVLYVDYIQLMAGSKYTQDRVREVGEISRGLKGLARELRVPVVALSQLSRGVESRSDHVPRLSDLRDSGEVEQDADIVLFPYRAELYDTNAERGAAELHIAKHRNGPLGVVPLRFDARTTQFRPLERYRTVEGY